MRCSISEYSPLTLSRMLTSLTGPYGWYPSTDTNLRTPTNVFSALWSANESDDCVSFCPTVESWARSTNPVFVAELSTSGLTVIRLVFGSRYTFSIWLSHCTGTRAASKIFLTAAHTTGPVPWPSIKVTCKDCGWLSQALILVQLTGLALDISRTPPTRLLNNLCPTAAAQNILWWGIQWKTQKMDFFIER